MKLISDIYFHGTEGDSIRQILDSGLIQPNEQGEIFFSRYNWQSCLMHGTDPKRKASFVIKIEVEAPPDTGRVFSETPGVRDTVVLRTTHPIPATVLELYVRGKMQRDSEEPASLQIIKGHEAIRRFLAASG